MDLMDAYGVGWDMEYLMGKVGDVVDYNGDVRYLDWFIYAGEFGGISEGCLYQCNAYIWPRPYWST